MAASSLNRDLFTIGWVCALQIEYLAARAFLENKCDLDSQESADNNAYTLGNIGKHHVVLAACPDGEYGIASAANVARDLARSFPRVRVGLLVGIGGGIPSKQHDIRLGDVVVSSQAGRTAAVVQYDMGKQLSDGTFQSTGQLDNPPASLRAALVKLQSVQDEEGNGLTKAIDQTLRSMRESLRAKYCRPQDGTDVLFRADVVHSSNQDGDCVDVCGSGADSLIWRKHRTSSDDTPAVHYGPIGSGNTVMKDAITRDALGQSHGIICFEMEAAGLMNTWPCVVIRGICDYADSHKNKHWQRYAALAAAAYARALILTLAPRQVETSTTIAEILARSEEHSQTLDRIERQVTTASQQRQTEYLRSWLQPVDPSTNYNKARSLRHDGTGDWLIKTEAFREWLSTPKSFLWLYGRPGCGKTVLSSTILSAISDDGKKWSKILYFYYDFADVNKQSMDSTLRTLLCQLAEIDEQHAEAIREFWHDHNDGSRQPGKEEMYAVLRRELQAAGEVYILLDALDECTTRGAGGSLSLLDWLKQLHQDVKGLRLLCTSRPESDIEESFLSWVPQESRISIRGEEVSSDIDAYVYAAVREFAGLQRWHDRPEVQDLICHTLSSKADGMFRWVSCQFDAISECVDLRQLEEALSRLPASLYETYDRMMERIDSHSKSQAYRLLRFLIYSDAPLPLEAAADLLLVDIDNCDILEKKYRLPRLEEITRLCPGLVTIVSRARMVLGPEQILQLSHFSVREYFRSHEIHPEFRSNFEEQVSYSCLTQVCLTYLLRYEIRDEDQRVNRPWLLRSSYDSLACYCADHWWQFAETVIDTDGKSRDLMTILFRPGSAEERWLAVCGSCAELFGDLEGDLRLYAAVSVECPWMVRMLLSYDDIDVNSTTCCDSWNTALAYAASKGNMELVKMLLDAGAQVNHCPGSGRDIPLVAAIIGNHFLVVRLLTEHGAVVNASLDSSDGSAIALAALYGSREMVEYFIACGADFNNRSGDLILPLAKAALKGRLDIVCLLLDNGADVNAVGRCFCDHTGMAGWVCTALAAAACRTGNEIEIIPLLLASGADIDACDENHASAITIAASRGDSALVKLLLAHGANVTGGGGMSWISPLDAAATGRIQAQRGDRPYGCSDDPEQYRTIVEMLEVAQRQQARQRGEMSLNGEHKEEDGQHAAFTRSHKIADGRAWPCSPSHGWNMFWRDEN